MTQRALCAIGCLAVSLAACGGSGSETPPPVEPTTPERWQDPNKSPRADEPTREAPEEDPNTVDVME